MGVSEFSGWDSFIPVISVELFKTDAPLSQKIGQACLMLFNNFSIEAVDRPAVLKYGA